MNSRTLITLVVTLAVLLVVFLLIHDSKAAVRHDIYPLTVGDAGPRVAGLQWMLGGNRPSKYRGINPYKGKPNGYFGLATKAAVKSAKFELGYPLKWVNGAAGTTLIAYLKGEVGRPRAYVLTAIARAKAAAAEAQRATAANTMLTRILTLARRYVGVYEVPLGSNCGHQVGIFQSATGAYCAAWCASFVQYILKTAGYGTIAYRSAHVYTIKAWAVARGWARSQTARPGRLVVFNSWQGHIGIVSFVSRDGFWSIEGNASDRVLSRFHPWGSRSTTMLQLPGVA